ncbi:MAG: beta-lactamase family protein [Opitutaceae bacterium]|jgi:CubicO group peptidase (beta-lactamase class C family)|nr:beta-lactamase family protein [Opitutaceae bacterium]
MKTRILTRVLAFLVLAQAVIAGPYADIIAPYASNNTTSGAVFLVADAQRVIACEAAGFADIASAKPMRPDTLFWIASMTKPITAAAFMMLVDEGKVALDDPVSKYIPEFATPQKIIQKSAPQQAADGQAAEPVFRKGPVTLRHLLSHTAGFRRDGDIPFHRPYNDALPLSKIVPLYATLDIHFEPGTNYRYSSIDIATIGRVIEVVAGIPYETFLQKRIFDPLGMTETTFWPTPAQLERLATPYRGSPKKHTLTPGIIAQRQYPLDDRVKRHPTPGGGLFSTAGDIAKFGQLLLNKGVAANGKRLLSEAAVAEMTRRQTPPVTKEAYGLCIRIANSGRSFGHSGAYGTQLSVWPKDGKVTVFMIQKINSWGGPDGDKLRPALDAQALLEK